MTPRLRPFLAEMVAVPRTARNLRTLQSSCRCHRSANFGAQLSAVRVEELYATDNVAKPKRLTEPQQLPVSSCFGFPPIDRFGGQKEEHLAELTLVNNCRPPRVPIWKADPVSSAAASRS